MNRPDDLTRLRHIADSARKAARFIKGKTRADLDIDEMLGLSLVRLLEVIGEATNGVSDELRERHLRVPWRLMCATRNRLIHGYYDVDMDIVWQIVANDLPPVIKQVRAIIRNMTR